MHKSKKKKRIPYSFIIFSLLLIMGFGVLYSYLVYTNLLASMLSEQGFISMEIENLIPAGEDYVLQLKSNCSELSIFISSLQAKAIEQGIIKKRDYRPMTHDILVDVIEGFGINPIAVKITKLEEGTYFAKLIFHKWNRFLILDARPSDAIAVAVRTDIPIYVNESLVMKVC